MQDTTDVHTDAFEPTYHGGKLERQFLIESLQDFYFDQLITDVLYKVKGGKEANVYCCAAHPATGLKLIAAKLYRPEAFRAMKNDWLYRVGREEVSAEGKAVRDLRGLRAMHKRTRIGKAMRSASWIRHEFGALKHLHEIGCDVPVPIASGERAILMHYIGDGERAAPTLHETKLDPAEAASLFDELLDNVAWMLGASRIHGDLSAFNVLYHQGRGVIIDLPQTVDPLVHPRAFELLTRDVTRLCQYFAKQGDPRDANELTMQLWEECICR